MSAKFSGRSFVLVVLAITASVFGSDPGNYIVWSEQLGWHASTVSGGSHELVDEVSVDDPCAGTFDLTYPNGTKLIEIGYHLSNGYDPCFDIRSQYIGGNPFLTESGVGSDETDEVYRVGQFSMDVLWAGYFELRSI